MALKLNNTLYFIQMTNYLMITRFTKDDIWNMNQHTKHEVNTQKDAKDMNRVRQFGGLTF